MKRRNFIKKASLFSLPLMLEGQGFHAFANNSEFVQNLLQNNALTEDRVLVVINMNGGNDGLNTVIPLDQYGLYQGFRSNIAIPQNDVLPLNNTSATGFHPAMTGMQQLYNNGKLSIINSVSYPNPNFSHYRSDEIMVTGTPSNVTGSTGWIGRYLDGQYPNYPNGYPTASMEDPVALQIGYLTSTLLAGPSQSMAVAVSNPEEFAELIGEGGILPPSDLPCCEAGDLVAYIRQQQTLSIAYASEIKDAALAGNNMATYPSNNSVADQLKIVSRLIHGGLKTKVYMVTQGGYDTHSGQVENDPTTGVHNKLLGELSDAIAAFQSDIEQQNIADKVIGMTYSEFGRRVNSNASKGTDHGVAAPMFIFGNSIKKSMVGTNPNLSDLTVESGQYNLKMQIDFRQVYQDILQDWFGLTPSIANPITYGSFEPTFVLSDTIKSIQSGDWMNPTTWNLDRVPNLTEKVLIQNGHTVTVRSADHITCGFVEILGGFDTEPGAVFNSSNP
ncbi:DUF1501 domain-containing protein [Arcticibacterium luteifluviistationis]|uniref:DUF1501 domain-containing protein n=1 Tax=Arcticibacterium luteifluviistationis TaxID=1784714 RepID=A0A2Z4GDR6_9BACT|nr:DUF1501 domain-containing protein [Arcticibacterium luteifluviistationis]AWV99386.1 hypothetical protein DJ013_14950 [Arcticibacterium luteifluviistationis]